MGKIFELHRKEIITGAGALLFIIAGALAMSFMPSENSQRPPNESQPQLQSQTQNQELNHEVKPQEQKHELLSEKRDIYVYLTGAVKKPGVYKFPEGSRIFEVIEAAGGFMPKADVTAFNLAETFTDAQHIHIPLKGERKLIAQTPNTNTNADTYTHITVKPSDTNAKLNVNQKNKNLVDINNASESELQRLTGVGPAIAKRIYEYRQKNGRFKSAEELIHVRGIGPAKLEKMRSQIIIR